MVNCFICNIILRAGNRLSRLINKPDQEEEITRKRRDLAVLHRSRFRLINQDIEEDSKVCVNCDMRITKVIALEDNEMAIPMEVLVRKQTEKCFICNKVRNDRLTLDARADFYIKTNIFIPGQVRCCANHLTECGYVKLEFMENIISIPSKIILSGKDISTWFSILREITQHQSGKKYEDENNFSDAELKRLTSLN